MGKKKIMELCLKQETRELTEEARKFGEDYCRVYETTRTIKYPEVFAAYARGFFKGYMAYKNKKRKMKQMKQWISIQDVLPEYGVSVLTIDNENQMEVLNYNSHRRLWFTNFGMDWDYSDCITHWMPLPKTER